MLCMQSLCQSESVCSIKVIVPPKSKFKCNSVEIYCNLQFCSVCVQHYGLDNVFTEEMKDQIIEMMLTNNAVPDFNKSKFEIVSINDVNFIMLEAHNQTVH